MGTGGVSADLPGGQSGAFWPSVPSTLREARALLSMATLRLRRESPEPTIAAGGMPVLLIPGFLAGDWTMSRLAHRLAGDGHAPVRAETGVNVGCTIELATRLEERLEDVVEAQGRPAAIVGWSRGGTLGRILAVCRPDLVAGLITLASPNVRPLAVNPVVHVNLAVLAGLHAVGVRRVLSRDCTHGNCAASAHELLHMRFPKRIPYFAVFSRSDGVVDWRACCDPAAQLIEVRATHVQMGANPEVIALVAETLAGLAARPSRRASSAG